MSPPSRIPLESIPRTAWDQVLAFCQTRDVEADDSPEYMYSARLNAGTLTVWTQPGWKGGYYVARIVAKPHGTRLRLYKEAATASVRDLWNTEQVTDHLLMLFHRCAPEIVVTRTKL